MSDLWVRRPYDSATDEDGVLYLWLKSYAHTRDLVEQGAHKDGSDAERRYWREHAPIVECILRSGIAATTVLCDPSRVHASADGPPVIMAFACTSGDVVHYVSVKRQYAREGFGPDMLAELLGDLLTKPCTYSHDLVEMRPVRDRRSGEMRVPCGVQIPSSWRKDAWWLSRLLIGGARAA